MITLEQVSKIYSVSGQTVHALRDVNLNIIRGERVAITGRSGAGKSTLLHIIGTLDRASHGTLTIDGVAVGGLTDAELAKLRNHTIGFVFQSHQLMPELDVEENVALPGLIAGITMTKMKSRVATLVESVGLQARRFHRPSELSGGEQQRVAIARALLMQPSIVLADEPTGNLDRANSEHVQDLLFRLCDEFQITLLLVTHDESLASQLPRRVRIEDGRVVTSA